MHENYFLNSKQLINLFQRSSQLYVHNLNSIQTLNDKIPIKLDISIYETQCHCKIG